jgi:hypothetical protein
VNVIQEYLSSISDIGHFNFENSSHPIVELSCKQLSIVSLPAILNKELTKNFERKSFRKVLSNDNNYNYKTFINMNYFSFHKLQKTWFKITKVAISIFFNSFFLIVSGVDVTLCQEF